MSASEICSRLYLDKAALALLQPAMSPPESWTHWWQISSIWPPSTLSPMSLPAREGDLVGDASACSAPVETSWSHGKEGRSGSRLQWVLWPDEANRAATKQPAEVLGPASAAG